MMLTDIHLGGGFWSREKDRKTVYEIITMLQKEKPDLVILDGDNTFAVPGPVYNGGGTLNNYMAARDVIQIFNHEGVYFSTVFGNHDTEVFDYTGRQKLGELYMNDKFEYCIFDQNYTDGGDLPTVTNQIIQVKNNQPDHPGEEHKGQAYKRSSAHRQQRLCGQQHSGCARLELRYHQG